MSLRDTVTLSESASVGAGLKNRLTDVVVLGRASMTVVHRRAQDFIKDAVTGLLVPDPRSYKLIDEPETVWNQITNSGRDFLHVQGYSSVAAGGSAPASSGLNFIALTNTAITPAAGDTTLSGEIVANGLARAQATYAHTGGTNTTTLDKTFTCASAPQAAQAAALFALIAGGTMNHELTFTQRSLIVSDTLQITYTITLG